MSKEEDLVPLLEGAERGETSPSISSLDPVTSSPDHIVLDANLMRLLSRDDDSDGSSSEEAWSSSEQQAMNDEAAIWAGVNSPLQEPHAPEEEFSWGRCSSRVFLCLYVTYWISMSLAVGIVLAVDWEEKCDQPLHVWFLAQFVLVTLGAAARILTVVFEPSNSSRQFCRVTLLKYSIATLNTIWFVWFIVGMVWTFKTDSNQCSPSLRTLSLVLIFVNIGIAALLFLLGCCLTACIVGLYCTYPHLFRSRNQPEGAAQSVINALRQVPFTKNLVPEEDESCAICLENYKEGDDIRFLPCKPKEHHFHKTCVDQWLVMNKTCPFCKNPIDQSTTEDNNSENVVGV